MPARRAIAFRGFARRGFARRGSARWMFVRRMFVLAVAPILLAACAVPSAPPAEDGPPPPIQADAAQARALAREAYLRGVPMLAAYQMLYGNALQNGGPLYKGPLNTLQSSARVYGPDDPAFVSPNADTPYTYAALDLRREPLVLTVPPVDRRRYYAFQFTDLYGYNFAYVGTRATGGRAGRYLIAGPGWKGKAPRGISKVLRSETDLVNVVGRTQLLNPADLRNVVRIQEKYGLQPLSAYLGRPAPPAPPAPDWMTPLSLQQAARSLKFFDALAFLLPFAPGGDGQEPLARRLAPLGLAPGRPYHAERLPPALQEALRAGMHDGQTAIDTARAEHDGSPGALYGSREALGGDPARLAAGAQAGAGGVSREEAIFMALDKDSAGAPLDGGYRYSLHFPRGGLPPVNGFWSITMYAWPSQLLVKNDINRYVINSEMLPRLKRDADGGITLYVQRVSPGKDRVSNWLPAPDGPFMLALRYYWPKPALLQGKWKPPQLVREALRVVAP